MSIASGYGPKRWTTTVESRGLDAQQRIAELEQQLVAVQTEVRELREKLERMVEIREAAVDVMGNALRLNGGGFHVYQRPLERLITALSQPESRTDVIGQNGNDGHHYADAEHESLPLMARREWMFKGAQYAFRDRDSAWFQSVDKPGGVWEFCYRIADTDEHGNPVVPRTAKMPADAKYTTTRTGRIFTEYPRAHEIEGDEGLARIEDYRESGQEGKE